MGEMNGSAVLSDEPMPQRSDALAQGPQVSPDAQPLPFDQKRVGDEWRESGGHWDSVTAWFEMRRQLQRRRQKAIAAEGRTVVVNGYGGSLSVKRDQLIVHPGHAYSSDKTTDELLTRGSHGVNTIVLVTNGGAASLSTPAIKWCCQQSISIVIVTERGECLGVINPLPDAPPSLDIPGRGVHYGGRSGRPDVRLRRAQYMLRPAGAEPQVGRWLIERKCAAQLECVASHGELPDRDRASDALETALSWLRCEPIAPHLQTLAGIRAVEAGAARGYFAAWIGLKLRLDAKARNRWPQPWQVVAERNSPLTRWHSPQNATNPAQAALNFLFGMLESQVRQSLNVIGADVACGIVHADDPNRDALVYDAMEPLRGRVEHLFLQMLRDHVFSVGDFIGRSDGSVVLHPSLCKALVSLCRLPQRAVDDEIRLLRDKIMEVSRVAVASVASVASDENE
jgi:CRISPR-associated endonuclease Cas1